MKKKNTNITAEIHFDMQGETKLRRYRKVTDTPSDEVTLADLELVEETDWMPNMLLNQGKDYMAKEDTHKWFSKYAFGAGTTQPTADDTELENEYATLDNRVDIGEIINTADYTNGYWTITRTWQSDEITENVTITNAGIKDSSNRLMTYLVYLSQFNLTPGDYFLPSYRLRIAMDLGPKPRTLTTPISGVASDATMGLESLIGLTQRVYTYNDRGDIAVDYFEANGLTPRYYYEESHASGLFAWFWPYYYYNNVYSSAPRCFISSYSDPISFSNDPSDISVKTGYFGYANDWYDDNVLVKNCTFSTYSDGDYYRDITCVFYADEGNLTDIISVGFCAVYSNEESSSGYGEFHLESLFRILFDSPFTKSVGQVLTLTFRISWS